MTNWGQGGVAGKRRRWEFAVQVADGECQHTSATSPRARG
jgi:hypothetical protein